MINKSISALLVLALSVFLVGCADNPTAPQQVEEGELQFTITNSGQDKSKAGRQPGDVGGIEAGDQLNLFVTGDGGTAQQKVKVTVPNEGESREVTFAPLPTDEQYTVSLIAYEPLEDANYSVTGQEAVSGSVILGAATPEATVDVYPNQLTTVDFTTNSAEGRSDKFQRVLFGFNFPNELTSDGENIVSVDLNQPEREENVAGAEQFLDTGGGQVAIAPEPFTVSSNPSNLVTSPYTYPQTGLFESEPFVLSGENGFGTSQKVEVLNILQASENFEAPGQNLVILNNVQGESETVELGGDGGIVIIFNQ